MVSTVLIEECVLQRLQFLFSIDSVLDMDDSLITSVAAESSGSAIQRKRLTEKMKTLEKGLVAMRNFEKLNLNPKSVCQDPIGGEAQITNGGPFQLTAHRGHDGSLESRLACEPDHVQRSYHRAHRTEWLWNTQAGLPTRSHTAPYQSRMGHPE
jgi:hypothetical protein